MKITTSLSIALLLAACGDDTTIIQTTFTWTSPHTSNGNMSADDDGGDAPTSDGMPDGTTGDEETTDGSTSEGLGPTTGSGGNGGTGGSGNDSGDEAPIVDPPFGCGVIVEALLNAPVDERYVLVDVSACTRPQNLKSKIDMFVGGGVAEASVPVASLCLAYGGANSVVADVDGFQSADLAGADADLSSFGLSVYVDGVQTDNVRVPAILKGQAWQSAPDAPDQSMRRTTAFAWKVTGAHVPGCDLLAE